MTFVLLSGAARAVVDPEAGGRIAVLEVAGHSLLVPRRDDPLAWGCYPMAPFAGRVRRGRFRFGDVDYTLPINLAPHAIHGTTFDRSWHAVDEGRLQIDLGPDWPFEGSAVQQIALEEDRLRLRLEVRSAENPFPASLGWHPWFVRELAGVRAELSFEAAEMYERDADGIPTGQRITPPAGPWDDCFTRVVDAPRVRWPGVIEIAVVSSVDHWVVYDEPSHALCIEPQTGPPDALNLAPNIVTPEHPLVAEAEIRWRLPR